MADQLTEIGRIAYHEAGHAVINLIFGLPFQSVSLNIEEKPACMIEDGKKVDVILTYVKGIVFPKERVDSVNKALLAGILNIKEALSLMAGPVAERIFVGKMDDQAQIGAREDVQAIRACCRVAMSGSGKPEEWKEIPEMENFMIAAITVGAGRLLKENWICVQAIAETLIKKKELDYTETAKIAEAKGLSKKE
jgi:hypothetical protein